MKSWIARRVATGVALALVAGGLSTVGTQPAVAAPKTWSLPTPDDLPDTPVATVKPGTPKTVTVPTYAVTTATWPEASDDTVTSVARGSKPAQVGKGPLRVAAGSAASSDPGSVRAQVLAQEATRPLVGAGVVTAVSATPGAQLAVTMDYSGFATAGGAGFASRLRLVGLPACALTTPDRPECRIQTDLGSINDPNAHTLTAQVTIPTTVTGSTLMSTALMAAVASSSSASGDFTATSLSSSSTWASGGQGGAFTWSYPLRTPPVAGGLAPTLQIGYSSAVADGRVSATNNQASWLGEGFSLGEAFIERRYGSCSDQVGTPGVNNTTKTGDLCWASDAAKSNNQTFDNAVLTMSGHAGELVRDGNTSLWRLRDDDGTRVEKVNSIGGDEYWKVTTTDGTQYFFGKGKADGAAAAATNSRWSVPVAGNNVGEPGNTTSFSTSFTNQPWRWNLDYVVSPHGDSLTYYYAKETNRYLKNLTADTSYDRGGYLTQISYGERQGAEATTPPAKVTFAVKERCLTSVSASCETAAPTSTTTSAWPEVPLDQLCDGSYCPSESTSPTFFTRKRLSQVATAITTGSGYDTVDTWDMAATYPAPLDASVPALWLDTITHTGRVGTPVTIPAVKLTPALLSNRVTGLTTGVPLTRPRLTIVTTEGGGQLQVSYLSSDCSADTVANLTPATNTSRCYPSYFSDNGATPTLNWFNKFLVMSVNAQDYSQQVNDLGTSQPNGNPSTLTSYTYSNFGWRYDDSILTPTKNQTWNQWRGAQSVTTVTGFGLNHFDVIDPQTVTRSLYFQGLDGDKNGSGGVKAINITDSTNTPWRDDNQLAGLVRESRTLTGPTGSEDNGTITDPISSQTVTDGHVKAYMVATAQTRSRQTIANGATRTVTTKNTYDNYGRLTETEDTGDNAITGDETCTRTSYATNTTAWILDTVAEQTVMPTTCATAVDSNQVNIWAQHFYDNSTTLGAAPTRGLATLTKTWSGSGTNRQWATTSATYDQHGRTLAGTDPLGHTTTTSYTPTTGSPVTGITVTTPDPDGSGPGTPLVTSTTIDPHWGTNVKQTQPGNLTSQASLDALGRVVSVWSPGRATTLPATAKYTYSVNPSGTNTSWVQTDTLKADGTSYLTSYSITDSLFRPRVTQTPAQNGTGRIVTEQRYDDRGLVSETTLLNNSAAPNSQIVEPILSHAAQSTSTTYDYASRPLVTTTYQMGVELWHTAVTYTNDTTTVTPPAGGVPTKTVTDIHGRTTQLIQNPATSATTTTYSYDTTGNLTTMKDPKNNLWTYTYDLQGHQITSGDPDKGLSTTTFDLAGNPISTTDARGQGIKTVYDNLNRVTQTTDLANTPLTATTYDTVTPGKATSSVRYLPGGTQLTSQVNSYDTAGRPTSATTTIPTVTGLIPAQLAGNYTTTTNYNPDGSINTVGLPITGPLPAETLSYTYNTMNLPYSLTGALSGPPTGYVTKTNYNSLGQISGLYLNSITGQLIGQTYAYSGGTNRLIGINNGLQNGGVLETDTLTYDNAGNITKLAGTGKIGTDTQCFTYDNQQQLTEAWTPTTGDCTATKTQTTLAGPAPYWNSWTTDTIGNTPSRTDRTTATATTYTYTYPANGTSRPHFPTQLAATGTTPATTSYTADAAGNTLTRTIAGQTQNFTWNTEGKLDTVTNGATLLEKNIYDASGNRILRTDQTGTTLTIANTDLKLDTVGVVTATRQYTWAGHTIAQRTGTTNDTLTYQLVDAQGTPHFQINAATSAYQTQWQTPYGAPRNTPTPWTGQHGFLNGIKDTTLGYTHLGAREYDPTLQRFITVDPVQDTTVPLQWNAYTYCENSPITHSDPTGLIDKVSESNTWDDSDKEWNSSNSAVTYSKKNYIAKHGAFWSAWKPPVKSKGGLRSVGRGQNVDEDSPTRPDSSTYKFQMSLDFTTMRMNCDVMTLNEHFVNDVEDSNGNLLKAYARFLMWFKGMNQPGGAWDSKAHYVGWLHGGTEGKLADDSTYSSLTTKNGRHVLFNYDVWGNMEYGYNAANMGLSVEQAIAIPKLLGQAQGGVDDPGDDVSIRIGYDAYKAHPVGITSAQLQEIMEAQIDNPIWNSSGRVQVK
ncbi:MAG: RHS repeat protein [Micropruina sp.]|nr:RHS repeat protein [Micropruina sp.]